MGRGPEDIRCPQCGRTGSVTPTPTGEYGHCASCHGFNELPPFFKRWQRVLDRPRPLGNVAVVIRLSILANVLTPPVEHGLSVLSRRVHDLGTATSTTIATTPGLISLKELDYHLATPTVTMASMQSSERFWILIAAVLVFVMQVGFKFLEVGIPRKESTPESAAQKLASWGIASAPTIIIGITMALANQAKNLRTPLFTKQ